MFSFTYNPVININFTGQENRRKKKLRVHAPSSGSPDTIEVPVYAGHESVSGTVEIAMASHKKIDHQGIRIELVGQTELYSERNSGQKFLSLVRELESAGTLNSSKTYSFDFANEKPHDTYSGINVRLRYVIRVTITRSYNSCVKEAEFAVENFISAPVDAVPSNNLVTATSSLSSMAPSSSNSAPSTGIKMEVGIEDCLHIEFEFDRQKYHLEDIIVGRIHFLLVKIKIKLMEIALIRRESTGSSSGSNPTVNNESENVVKFELMDGAPIKGECVPIRLFLSSLPLTPTYRSINNCFSVKYYLNLVLIDEEDRRYFKQQEVTFWRRGDPSHNIIPSTH